MCPSGAFDVAALAGHDLLLGQIADMLGPNFHRPRTDAADRFAANQLEDAAAQCRAKPDGCEHGLRPQSMQEGPFRAVWRPGRATHLPSSSGSLIVSVAERFAQFAQDVAFVLGRRDVRRQGRQSIRWRRLGKRPAGLPSPVGILADIVRIAERNHGEEWPPVLPLQIRRGRCSDLRIDARRPDGRRRFESVTLSVVDVEVLVPLAEVGRIVSAPLRSRPAKATT
jgi:hypothetical protein